MIESKDQNLKRILKIEMISRIVKKMIQDQYRNQMKQLQIPTHGPFIQIIVNTLNQLLIKDDQIWNHIMNQFESKYDISIQDINQIKQEINIIQLIQVIFLFFD